MNTDAEYDGVMAPLRLSEHPVVNGIVFQCLWFALVLGRDQWLPVTILAFAGYLFTLRHPFLEIRQVLPIVGLGVVMDSVLSLTGVFEFPATYFPIPFWLITLWVVFATTLTRAFAFLRERTMLTVVLGGVAVPLNYWVGANFGAVTLPLGTLPSLAIMAPCWAILLPTMMRLAYRGANDT
jgi:hypothetical protein